MTDNDCVFCNIVAGRIPAHVVYEDENHLAFLDINPSSEGQVLVIPKKHVNYVFDLPDAELGRLFAASKKVAKAIDKSLKTVRTCLVVEGFETPHVHVRLHPCFERRLSFEPMQRPSDEEFKATAAKIRAALK